LTTIIAKRSKDWFEIVADNRASGWYRMINDEICKLNKWIVFNWIANEPYVIAITGDSIHSNIIKWVLKSVELLFKPKDLRMASDFKDYHNFALFLFNKIRDESWIKEVDIDMIFVTKDVWLVIWTKWYIEDIKDLLSIWSWREFARWIHVAAPDKDIREYIPLVSSLDFKTSNTFDYIKL